MLDGVALSSTMIVVLQIESLLIPASLWFLGFFRLPHSIRCLEAPPALSSSACNTGEINTPLLILPRLPPPQSPLSNYSGYIYYLHDLGAPGRQRWYNSEAVVLKAGE